MKKTTLFLCVFPLLAACAADKSALLRVEDEQRRQTRLLAEQNALIEEQAVLLAEQIDAQRQMVEMLADMDRTLKESRAREENEASAEPPGDPDRTERERALVLSEEGKAVLGRNEWAWLELLNRNLKARIDTGALSSSLSAVDLQRFERDGDKWIRFRVPDEEHPDGGETYETPLVRHVRIRQASTEELERRPVVRLKVRVGELTDETEFTLTNRENMLYPVLLGRNFLRDIAVVDVARKFVQKKYSPARDETTAE